MTTNTATTDQTITASELALELGRKAKFADSARTQLQDRSLTCSLDFAEADVETITKAKVWLRVAKIISREPTVQVDEIRREALAECLRFAKFGHHSSSLLSNICAAAEASAWAEIAEMCGGVK
jgi:hypothetical protein